MARFYFHSRDGRPFLDRDGAEFADADAARIEAVCYLSELMRDEPQRLWRAAELEVTITDADGAPVGRVTATAVRDSARRQED